MNTSDFNFHFKFKQPKINEYTNIKNIIGNSILINPDFFYWFESIWEVQYWIVHKPFPLTEKETESDDIEDKFDDKFKVE